MAATLGLFLLFVVCFAIKYRQDEIEIQSLRASLSACEDASRRGDHTDLWIEVPPAPPAEER